MKLAITVLLATVAVAQTPAPKPVPQTAVAAPTTHCMCPADGNHHCSIIGLSPLSPLACDTVGGIWVEPAPLTYTPFNVNSTVVSGDVYVDNNVPGSVYVNSQTGRVVKLSDEEYERLQKLRQAVADEEKKIAAAHGVLLVPKLIHTGTNTCLAAIYITGLPSCDTDQYQPSDKWQFRGQWLLINVPSSAKGLR